VLADDIPSDLIECGVWRGGACILMRAVPDLGVWIGWSTRLMSVALRLRGRLDADALGGPP
jgi:hypothetical protein